MDMLTAIVSVAILLLLVAPIIEIAVRRPGIVFELGAGTRAFAEAGLQKGTSTTEAVAEDCEVPANDPTGDQRQAA